MPRTLVQNAQYINETIKPAIKSAIEAQGVTVPSTDSFLDYADRIGEIEGGGSGYQLKDLPTGSISAVTDAAPLPLNALKVSVEAWQEGSGTPYPAGGSKNKLNNDSSVWQKSYNNTGISLFNVPVQSDTTYTISCPYNNTGFDSIVCYILKANDMGAYLTSATTISGGNKLTFTTPSDWTTIHVRLRSSDYDSSDGAILLAAIGTNMLIQLEQGSTATPYTPYENIRPIHGWSTATITDKDDLTTPTQTETYTHAFTDSQGNPLECYGGEWDVVDGELKVTDGYIASYNGEALPGIWISDRDVYASGTTPTIGAEVVYKLATPTTIPISPLSIRLLEGTNNLYADCGEVLEGEYFVDEGAIDVRKVDYQIGSSGSIKTTDGRVLSGFASMNGYHARPLDASGNWLDVDWSKDFEIGVAFKFTAFPAYQGITGDGNANSYRKAPRLYYDNSEGKLALCVSSDGSTLAIDQYLNYSFVTDKWYFIKLKFVLSTMAFSVDISDDFDTFTNLYTGTMSNAPYHNTASLCFGGDAQQSNMASNTFLVDTFNTYIKGDGVNWGASTGAFPS